MQNYIAQLVCIHKFLQWQVLLLDEKFDGLQKLCLVNYTHCIFAYSYTHNYNFISMSGTQGNGTLINTRRHAHITLKKFWESMNRMQKESGIMLEY